VLERNGIRFVVRPEKLHMLEEGQEPRSGMTVEPGTVEQVVYVGMSTRYVVRLDRGEQLVAVRQNMDAPGQALRYEGRRVRLAWVPGHTYVLDHQRARGDSAAGD
jgi:putative spermidine/putrescine transport system ATP-binding protein